MARTEHLDDLDKALSILAEKKAVVDKAQAALHAAQTDYASAVEEAQALHFKFQSLVGSILPRQNAGR